jgi:hypothetical protein
MVYLASGQPTRPLRLTQHHLPAIPVRPDIGYRNIAATRLPEDLQLSGQSRRTNPHYKCRQSTHSYRVQAKDVALCTHQIPTRSREDTNRIQRISQYTISRILYTWWYLRRSMTSDVGACAIRKLRKMSKTSTRMPRSKSTLSVKLCNLYEYSLIGTLDVSATWVLASLRVFKYTRSRAVRFWFGEQFVARSKPCTLTNILQHTLY